jgi:hypothetical protein|tara:strand:- start:41 stop:289 length:249 start_codon:yes stop_codon:yes gene_type:complete
MFGNKNKKKLKKQGPNAPGGRPLSKAEVKKIVQKKLSGINNKKNNIMMDLQKNYNLKKKEIESMLTIGPIESLSQKGKNKKK